MTLSDEFITGAYTLGSITINGDSWNVQVPAVTWDSITGKPTFATVATSGSYNDLSDKPSIPAAQVQADYSQSNSAAVDYIKNKPDLSVYVEKQQTYNDGNDYRSVSVDYWADDEDSQIVLNNTDGSDIGSLGIASGIPFVSNGVDSYELVDSCAKAQSAIQSSDLATVATTGDYDDLLDKPTIPDAVSGVNDGTNWTSITIGNTTKAIPQGSSVNIDDQTIIEDVGTGKIKTAIGGYIGSVDGYDTWIDYSITLGEDDTNNFYNYSSNGYKYPIVQLADGKYFSGAQNDGTMSAVFATILNTANKAVCEIYKNGTKIIEYTYINEAAISNYTNYGFLMTDEANQTSTHYPRLYAQTNNVGNIIGNKLRYSAYDDTNTGVWTQFSSGDVLRTVLKTRVSTSAYIPLDGRFLPIDGTTVTLNASNQLQAFSGSYTDLSNKPTIPDAVVANPTVPSGTTPTTLTGLQVGSGYYDISSGGGSSITLVGTAGSESISDGTTTLNVATRDTAQTISGQKTFTSNNKLLVQNTTNNYASVLTGGTKYLKIIANSNNGDSNYNRFTVAIGEMTDGMSDMLTLAPISNGGMRYWPFCLGTPSNPWNSVYIDVDGKGSYQPSGIGGKIVIKNLPTSDPQVEGQLWNDNGVLKISAGV